MGYLAHCPACSNEYDANTKKEINEIASKWERREREIIRKAIAAERARIRKGIRERCQEIQRLTPGEGGPADEWQGAAKLMRDRALEVVR